MRPALAWWLSSNSATSLAWHCEQSPGETMIGVQLGEDALTRARLLRRRKGDDDVFYLFDTVEGKVVEAPRRSLKLGDLEPALEGVFDVETRDGTVKVTTVFERLKAQGNRLPGAQSPDPKRTPPRIDRFGRHGSDHALGQLECRSWRDTR